MTRTYASPEAFKQALESHIRAAAQQRGFGIARMRQLLIVERLLVRLHAGFGDRIITKGGLALEMRLARARTTKDLDLRLSGDAASLLPEAVTKAARGWAVCTAGRLALTNNAATTRATPRKMATNTPRNPPLDPVMRAASIAYLASQRAKGRRLRR